MLQTLARTLWATVTVLTFIVTVGESISCFNCSSVNDNYCPEKMSHHDEGIVPYVSCSGIYDAHYCVKTTGVNGGCKGIHCFNCVERLHFGCSEALFSANISDCKDVFEANYCVKTTGAYGGSLGTTRFCSSKDVGNYCEYIKRPGDSLEYRSCVYTCSSDGCNGSAHVQVSRVVMPYLLLLLVFLA